MNNDDHWYRSWRRKHCHCGVEERKEFRFPGLGGDCSERFCATPERVIEDLSISCRSFIAYRKKSINICDHARSGVCVVICRDLQISVNFPNYIWSYKNVIGTNDLVSDIKKEQDRDHLKANLRFEKNDRAVYDVQFDGQPLVVDAETVISLIIEYQIYLAFKEPVDGYSDVSKVAKRLMDTNSTAVITVVFPRFPHR